MYWWKDFDAEEVNEDFKRLSRWGVNTVRIFLTWEDFQPQPEVISNIALGHLQKVADLAKAHGLYLMPTFFCGHMSGVNWIPDWMLLPGTDSERFPVYSNSQICRAKIRNYYTEQDIIEAQSFQIKQVCSSVKGHESVIAYDLGNESSNCVIPPHPTYGQSWLRTMTSMIKLYSNGIPVTLGMHAEDLEENRNLGPQDAALYCDFLCMHGYPFYLPWVKNSYEVEVLPFLGVITAWLGQKPVLFQEFGAPTYPILSSVEPETVYKCPLGTEYEVADYYDKAVQRLYEENMIGCMAWCFADYTPDLWNKPPLSQNPHERHFGLFRHDGSFKPAIQVMNRYINKPVNSLFNPPQNQYTWLKGEDRTTFYDAPAHNLIRLYRNYKEALT
jgi:endo-1,4-beta-mannosidase